MSWRGNFKRAVCRNLDQLMTFKCSHWCCAWFVWNSSAPWQKYHRLSADYCIFVAEDLFLSCTSEELRNIYSLQYRGRAITLSTIKSFEQIGDSTLSLNKWQCKAIIPYYAETMAQNDQKNTLTTTHAYLKILLWSQIWFQGVLVNIINTRKFLTEHLVN